MTTSEPALTGAAHDYVFPQQENTASLSPDFVTLRNRLRTRMGETREFGADADIPTLPTIARYRDFVRGRMSAELAAFLEEVSRYWETSSRAQLEAHFLLDGLGSAVLKLQKMAESRGKTHPSVAAAQKEYRYLVESYCKWETGRLTVEEFGERLAAFERSLSEAGVNFLGPGEEMLSATHSELVVAAALERMG